MECFPFKGNKNRNSIIDGINNDLIDIIAKTTALVGESGSGNSCYKALSMD